MRAGYASADMTPQPSLTLSGFVARRNEPSTGIYDRLSVRALALEEHGETILLLVFDLLGLGPELTADIQEALDHLTNRNLPQSHRILCCTHNHSAPATIKLLGCGIADRGYWDHVVAKVKEAAGLALKQMRPARLRYTIVPLAGCNYNRRQVLMDGRVVMTWNPGVPIRKQGPTWDQMLLLRLEGEDGVGIAGIASWAAHPCTICTQMISADYPGELCRRLSERYRLPFLFLQGACGNLNPPFREMTRETMLRNVDVIMEKITDVTWLDAVATTPFGLVDRQLHLQYDSIPTLNEVEEFRDGMESIAKSGSGPRPLMAMLSNILNVEPGKEPDPKMARFIASALHEWSEEAIRSHSNNEQDGRDLSVKVLRV
ncbi:MAG: neutral/alkaline non-lysosomal ceramidase N-terminal domain-containing protein, partial [Bacteroidota bacterium]